ncbi:unnamed protein product [Schistocephalus solidus]|uniref:Dynein light chain n=1 Tax=Schistocephalus solidus TaxID=70667 RepID=A0A183TEI8_SCHSO|nr:unnamed protein product [Schistocephalus solidus]
MIRSGQDKGVVAIEVKPKGILSSKSSRTDSRPGSILGSEKDAQTISASGRPRLSSNQSSASSTAYSDFPLPTLLSPTQGQRLAVQQEYQRFPSAKDRYRDMSKCLDEVEKTIYSCVSQKGDHFKTDADLADHIKYRLNKDYGPNWHCIIGKNYG